MYTIIHYQVVCDNDIVDGHEVIDDVDWTNETLSSLKKKIAQKYQNLLPNHIEHVIKDSDNTKLTGETKKLITLIDENESLTVQLFQDWEENMEDNNNNNEEMKEQNKKYQVEKILGHKYIQGKSTKNKKDSEKIMFVVKWEGYDKGWNTLEPASNLKDCSVWHDYIKMKWKKNPKSKLIDLIPKKYL